MTQGRGGRRTPVAHWGQPSFWFSGSETDLPAHPAGLWERLRGLERRQDPRHPPITQPSTPDSSSSSAGGAGSETGQPRGAHREGDGQKPLSGRQRGHTRAPGPAGLAPADGHLCCPHARRPFWQNGLPGTSLPGGLAPALRSALPGWHPSRGPS